MAGSSVSSEQWIRGSMATGAVLPLEPRAREWYDNDQNVYPGSTPNHSSRLLQGSMARPPHGAEPSEDTFAHKPILPPFSTFLSNAGRSDLFAQGRPHHTRAEPSISSGAPLNDLLHSSPFKSSEPHQYRPADSYPRRQSIQPDWPFPTTSPLGSHPPVPNPLSQELSIDRALGGRIVREEVIPGKGLCYIYEDGSIAQKAVSGDAVNPKWGTTKAGKPRKRLGQACNTCREKKIKCDPSVPKCAQCQKFGRECKFDTMFVKCSCPRSRPMLTIYAGLAPALDKQVP